MMTIIPEELFEWKFVTDLGYTYYRPSSFTVLEASLIEMLLEKIVQLKDNAANVLNRLRMQCSAEFKHLKAIFGKISNDQLSINALRGDIAKIEVMREIRDI